MTTYNYYREHQSPMNAPKGNGTFWLYAKLDFAKQNFTTGDNLKIFKVKDKWILLRGFTRTLVASNGDSTADIGTQAGGQELDVAQDPYAAGDWVIMATLLSGGEIALTGDGYIYYECLEADMSSGITEVIIEVYAGPEDAEGTDSYTED